VIDWKRVFDTCLDYSAFLDRFGTADQVRQWNQAHKQVTLGEPMVRVFSGFTRRMNVICLAGAWCGDCVRQCPILQRFAEASSRIDLRFLDRDAQPDVAKELTICGGGRVPVVVFLSEDFAECGRYGDRTASAYRRMASEQLDKAPPALSEGPNDSTPNSVITDWLGEFERIQLMLRLSPRLRRLHND